MQKMRRFESPERSDTADLELALVGIYHRVNTFSCLLLADTYVYAYLCDSKTREKNREREGGGGGRYKEGSQTTLEAETVGA